MIKRHSDMKDEDDRPRSSNLSPSHAKSRNRSRGRQNWSNRSRSKPRTSEDKTQDSGETGFSSGRPSTAFKDTSVRGSSNFQIGEKTEHHEHHHYYPPPQSLQVPQAPQAPQPFTTRLVYIQAIKFSRSVDGVYHSEPTPDIFYAIGLPVPVLTVTSDNSVGAQVPTAQVHPGSSTIALPPHPVPRERDKYPPPSSHGGVKSGRIQKNKEGTKKGKSKPKKMTGRAKDCLGGERRHNEWPGVI